MFESEHFRKQVVLLNFTPSVMKWHESTMLLVCILKWANMLEHMHIKILHLNLHQWLVQCSNWCLIKEFERLSGIAKYQLDILNNAEKIKSSCDVKEIKGSEIIGK